MNDIPEKDSARGVFGMSVAAELVGMDPQSLRLYERKGLIDPHRTAGGTRRYSPDDLERLRRIKDLLAAGLNLAGIAMVLNLEADNDLLRSRADGTSEADSAFEADSTSEPSGTSETDDDGRRRS